MNRSDVFMKAVYAAIADNAIPRLMGFGNGVDRRGSAYINEVLTEYPVLGQYMEDETLRVDAFQRYNAGKP